ncbi:MAG: type II toxin-antitoxin system HipA family toxin [Deltaproteobacteria bacterium]|nr:type II toxin-antitoxin system HipA family toxin [Deltaproteobacteria bacterium]
MTEALDVLLGDAPIGRLTRARGGRLSFAYDEAWRSRRDAYPLSVSMPLVDARHEHDVVLPYLQGLLPDNERILEAWGRRFQVSASSAFDLLVAVGDDCSGAVRFLPSDRAGAPSPEGRGAVEWLAEADVAARLRELRRDPSAWRVPSDAGQFSLGGAQAKTALTFDGKRWGVPRGRRATTHILKPGLAELEGHVENEHFCLALAAALGLPVARSSVARFEDEVAICIERFDRERDGRTIRRVHQEDFCQALSVMPERKYENTGGPGIAQMVSLLRERSRSARDDIAVFLRAIAFAWVIAGTDAHAKNYSLFVLRGGAVRLTPLYDVASFLPYAPHGLQKVKLAMKVGGKYRLLEIGVHEWKKLAREVGADADELGAEVAALCREVPAQCEAVLARVRKEGLRHRVLPQLAELVAARADRCARLWA